MTIRIGDHLVIKRGGKILTPQDEAYHEFEVIKSPEYKESPKKKAGYIVEVELVQ